MPLFTVSHSTSSITIQVTEAGFEPNVIVINKVASDGTKTNVAIPAFTVGPNLSLTLEASDGWYEITLQQIPPNTEETQYYIKTGAVEACRDTLRDSYITACCGCENEEDKEKYLKVAHTLEVVNTLITAQSWKNAACLVEGVAAICDSENCEGC